MAADKVNRIFSLTQGSAGQQQTKKMKKQITSAKISWVKWQSCIKTCRSAAWLLSIKVRAILDGKRPWMTRQTPTRLRTTCQKKPEKMPCVEKLTGHLENKSIPAFKC